MTRSMSYRRCRSMATPIAIGIASRLNGIRTSKYGVTYGASLVTAEAINEPAHTAHCRLTATRNHFSCCLAMPVDLKKRTIRDAKPPARDRNHNRPVRGTRALNTQPSAEYGPLGSGNPKRSWLSETHASCMTLPAVTAQTIGRQRRDGSFPSGNRAGIRARRRIEAGYQIQPRSQMAKPSAGRAFACDSEEKGGETRGAATRD